MANLPTVVSARMLPMAPGGRMLNVPVHVTPKEALEGVTLFSVIKHRGREVVAETLKMLLAETVDTLSCNHPPGTRWLEIFASDWLVKYPYETVEDFVLFMEKIRTSAYGPLYGGRLDSAVLFERFEKYMQEKADLRERTQVEEQKRSRLAMDTAFTAEVKESDPEGMKKLREDLAELSKQNVMKRIDEALKPDPRRIAHIDAGLRAAAKAETGEQLLDALSTFPYDEVQEALQTRAQELGVILPTREEIIAAARLRARTIHKG